VRPAASAHRNMSESRGSGSAWLSDLASTPPPPRSRPAGSQVVYGVYAPYNATAPVPGAPVRYKAAPSSLKRMLAHPVPYKAAPSSLKRMLAHPVPYKAAPSSLKRMLAQDAEPPWRRQVCPDCGQGMAWSAYSVGAYKDGWACNHHEICGTRGLLGVSRCFCVDCKYDVCSDCGNFERTRKAARLAKHGEIGNVAHSIPPWRRVAAIAALVDAAAAAAAAENSE
jgi:hypothetical protein